MAKRSKEFYEGFNSKSCANPYPPASIEYNEFDRGWGQRVKRGYAVSGASFEGEPASALTLFKHKSKKVNTGSNKKNSFNELLTQYGLKK